MKSTEYPEYKDYKNSKISIRSKGKIPPYEWRRFVNFIEAIGRKPEGDYYLFIDPSLDTSKAENYRWKKRVLERPNKTYPEYVNWKGMNARCHAPSFKDTRDYQAKGIKVCGRWRNFHNFYKDMGPKPTSKHSIDRIDNNGNYEPANCRWATTTVQARNTSKNTIYTVDGVTGCVPELAEHFKICANSLHKSLYRGNTIEDAVQALSNMYIEYKGYRLTKGRWADMLGVKRPTLYARFSRFTELQNVFEGYIIPDKEEE